MKMIIERIVFASPVTCGALCFAYWGFANGDWITLTGCLFVVLATTGLVVGGEA